MVLKTFCALCSTKGMGMKMNKKCLIVFLILVLMCIGCQKTPEKEAVTSKIGGFDQSLVADKLADGEEINLDTPHIWKASEERNDGQVTLSVKLPLEQLKISNTPVIEMKNKEFTNADLKKMVDYFAEGRKVYEQQGKTKSELGYLKQRIDNKEGGYSNPIMAEIYQQQSSSLAEMIEKAPDEKSELREADIKFDVEKSLYAKQIYYLVYGKEEQDASEVKNRFRAMIGEKGEATVKAFSYNKSAGTTSNFYYISGNYYSESDIKLMEEDNESAIPIKGKDSYYGTTYKDFLSRIRTVIDKNGHDEGQGRQIAEKVLLDLKIKNMDLLSSVEAVWIDPANLAGTSNLEDDIWDFDWSKSKSGHIYKFTTSVNDLLADYKLSPSSDKTPEKSYLPPFGVESIEILVTEDGVKSFAWSNMSEEVRVVAENTKIYPFEQVQGKLFDHLFYTVASEGSGQGSTNTAIYKFNVSGARLGYTYISAYENPEHAWLVPAWFFDTRVTIKDGPYEWQRETTGVMINALDGGYIDSNYATIVKQNM